MTFGHLAIVMLPFFSDVDPAHRLAVDCKNPRVVVDPAVDPRWRSSIERLCEELDDIKDADASVNLQIQARGADIVLDASLPDGRTTERLVSSPFALRGTVLGLVTLPPPIPAAAPIPAPALASAPLTPSPAHAPTAPVRASTEPSPASVQPPPREPSIEVSAAAMGRVAGSPTTYLSTGVAASAGVRAASFLLGLTVRWDPFETILRSAPPGFEMENVGVGFIVTRRIAGAPALDVGATATLVEQAQSFTGATGAEVTKEQTEVRVGLTARALLGSGPLRSTILLEAEVSPSRIRREVRLDDVLPALPTWTLGVGFGGTWEAR
jgi:hypothetical protein